MKKVFLGFVFYTQLFFFNCQGQDCHIFSFESTNPEQVLKEVRKVHFNLSEKVVTKKSSWISGIEYYSCDEKYGFLVMTTKKGKNYIHRDVPIQVWKEFKYASSFGSFYNENLKGKYRFAQ